MWCRTILTAVAISYVICMLLWSGLQKEDLDAKTLEKLGRYNVNINDMNNEKWRQECLSGRVTTEVQRGAFGTFVNTEGIKNYVSERYPKIEKVLPTKFDDIAVVQHEVSNNKSKGYFDPTTEIAKKMSDVANVTKIVGNKAAIKIEYDLQNQHDVESVMNVWTKLTRYNTTLGTTPPTIPAAPTATTEQRVTYNAKNDTSTVQAETHNNGYVHSREMEHISRMLAEYLARQTVRTTTQRVPVTKVFSDDIPLKYWKLSNKVSVKEKPNGLNEQGFEISDKDNVTQNNLRFGEVISNSLLDETKSMPFDVTYDSAQLIQRIQVTPHTQIHGREPKLKKSMPAKKNNPLGIIFNLLQSKSDLYNNGVLISETEPTYQTTSSSKSNEQQENKKSYNLYDLFQIINFANRNISKKFIMNNFESTVATIKANTWESISLSTEKINKEFKASPMDKKDMFELQNLYEQFKAAPSKKIKTRHMNTYDDETMDPFEPEQVHKYNTNNNRIKLRPPDINKSKLYQNSYMEQSQPWVQARVPSVMFSSSESNNNQVIGMTTGFNKLEPYQNNQLLTDQNDAFKADSRILSEWGPSYDSIKMQSMNNFDRENEQRRPNNEKVLRPTKHSDSMSEYELQAVKADIIKEITEKVKRMVLKHIEEVSTTTSTTTTTTTTPTTTTAAPTTTTAAPTTTTAAPTATTAAPTTTTVAPTSTTVAPTTTSSTTTKSLSEKISTSLQQEFTETNQVMQKLMEIFKELKAVKNTSKSASQVPEYTTTVSYVTRKPPPLPKRQRLQVPAYSKPYFMQNPTILKPKQGNPYTSRIVVPINSIVKPPLIKAPQYTPLLNVQPTSDYHLGAITMQTNSDEIAPLAIKMSKPLKIISQNIVVTTTGKVDLLKYEQEQISIKQIEEKLRNPTKANHREELQYQSDVSTKRGRLAGDIKEHESRDHNLYKSKYMNREKQWFNNEFNGKGSTENTHPDMSRFQELHHPGRLSHLQHLGQPNDLSNFENFNLPREFSRPGFTKPEIHQNEVSHHPHSLQSAYTNYDHQPRYEPTKFHEKLEKIETWPKGSWKELKVLPTESNNDEISGRQQMPLMKIKQRMGYDDSHFTNFLKSQQKVTDMLEKILANNVKNSGAHSVETL